VIIILHDHAHTIRAGRVPTDVVLDLASELPLSVRLRVQPDEDELRATPKRLPCGCVVWADTTRHVCLSGRTEPHNPGYFGLAVALARRTWED